MQETWVWSLGQDDPLEKEMTTHSRNHAWEIPFTEEPGGLQPIELQRIGHNWEIEHTHKARFGLGLWVSQCTGSTGERLLNFTGCQETVRRGHRLEEGGQCVYPSSPPAPGESSACAYVSDGDGRVVVGLEDYSSSYWCVCFLVQCAFQRHPPSDRTLLTNFKTSWWKKYLTWPRRAANYREWGRRICDFSLLFWVNQGMDP